MVEALGVSLPGNAAIPAVDARRARLAQLTGRRIVEMVNEDLRLSKILTRHAFENAIKSQCSDRRVHQRGDSFDCPRGRSVCADAGGLGPPGFETALPGQSAAVRQVLMEDLYYAGGLPAVMKEIVHLLHGDALTANGQSIAANIADAPCENRDVIRPFADPFKSRSGHCPYCTAISRSTAR